MAKCRSIGRPSGGGVRLLALVCGCLLLSSGCAGADRQASKASPASEWCADASWLHRASQYYNTEFVTGDSPAPTKEQVDVAMQDGNFDMIGYHDLVNAGQLPPDIERPLVRWFEALAAFQASDPGPDYYDDIMSHTSRVIADCRK